MNSYVCRSYSHNTLFSWPAPCVVLTAAKENVCGAFFPPPMGRGNIGKILEDEGFTTGIELGVQRGLFARETLESWPSIKTYYLVDAWRKIENYVVSVL
jgi:hypothetical protein